VGDDPAARSRRWTLPGWRSESECNATHDLAPRTTSRHAGPGATHDAQPRTTSHHAPPPATRPCAGPRWSWRQPASWSIWRVRRLVQALTHRQKCLKPRARDGLPPNLRLRPRSQLIRIARACLYLRRQEMSARASFSLRVSLRALLAPAAWQPSTLTLTFSLTAVPFCPVNAVGIASLCPQRL
jgi:hypothetical protein